MRKHSVLSTKLKGMQEDLPVEGLDLDGLFSSWPVIFVLFSKFKIENQLCACSTVGTLFILS
jgi:hypothetical protein